MTAERKMLSFHGFTTDAQNSLRSGHLFLPKDFESRSEAFMFQCLQYRWNRECLYACYYLCLSVPGSEMCLVTGDRCLLFPCFAAEL